MEYIGDLMKKIIQILILFSLISVATAETGSIVIEDTKILNYTPTWSSTPSWYVNLSFILFDRSNYTAISSFHVHLFAPTFAHGFESSPFICYNGSTCTGIVYYDANSSAIYYALAPGGIFPTYRVDIHPETKIFDNITTIDSYYYVWIPGGFSCTDTSYEGCFVTSVHSPVMLYERLAASTTVRGVPGDYHDVQVSSYGVDYYNVTYLPYGNLFQIALTKNILLYSKYYFLSDTTKYGNETTYNNDSSDDYVFTYADGLYLNATLGNGYYNKVLVNSTGISGYVPPQEPIVVDPVTGVGMIFSSSSYIIGSTANLSWIRTISTPITLQDRIEIKNQDGVIVSQLINPPDTGFIKFIVNDPGTYTAQFIRCSFFCVLTYKLAEATTTVLPDQPSYILVNSSIYAGKAENITYYNGVNGKINNLNVYYLDALSESYILTDAYLSIIIGTETTKSFTCSKIGRYKFELELSGAIAYSQCTQSNNYAQYNITTSNLTLSSYSLAFGDWFTYSYRIDSVNWTGNITRISVLDKNSIEVYNATLPMQKEDIVNLMVSDTLDSSNYMRFGDGTNNIRMITNKGIILDNHTVTVSSINKDGYGLTVKDTMCTKDSKTFTYYAPDKVNITIYDANNKIVKNLALNLSVLGKTIPITLGAGEYEIRLYSSDNLLQMSRKTTVNSCTAATIPGFPGQSGTWTPTQTSIAPTCSFWDECVRTTFGTQGVNDVTRILFALGCIVAMMFIGLVASKGNFGAAIILGFFPYAFFTYLSLSSPCGQYMPLWINIFIALIIGIKMKWFS